MYKRVYVEITNICNMACSFCHGHSRPPRMMNEDEFETALQKLSPHTQYIYYHLMGEPLTHPNLARFLEIARDRGFKSEIVTNGTLLATRGDILINAGIHKVCISLHSFENGDEAAHERYLASVCDFADRASKAGIITVLRLWNKGCDEPRNVKALEIMRSRLEGEWVENTRGMRIREKLFLEWGERFEWPDKNAAVYGERVFCYGLRDHFGVLSDGSVVPCCLDSDGVMTLGNIFTDDLDKILESPRALAIKDGFSRRRAAEDICKRCGYAQRFGG